MKRCLIIIFMILALLCSCEEEARMYYIVSSLNFLKNPRTDTPEFLSIPDIFKGREFKGTSYNGEISIYEGNIIIMDVGSWKEYKEDLLLNAVISDKWEESWTENTYKLKTLTRDVDTPTYIVDYLEVYTFEINEDGNLEYRHTSEKLPGRLLKDSDDKIFSVGLAPLEIYEDIFIAI